MLEKILTIFVLCAVFCIADDNAANSAAEQLLGHWNVVTEHNTHRPLNMSENTCVSIFKDFNGNLKFRSGDDLLLIDVVQRTIQNNTEFLIRDGEHEAKLVKVYPNELVWESNNELVVFYRIDTDVFPRACHFGSIPKKNLIEKLDGTLFDAKSLEYWFPQFDETLFNKKEELSNHPLESITQDKGITATQDKPKFIAHDEPQYISHDKSKFMADNTSNSFTEDWKRKMYSFHRIHDGEASPRTVLHYFREGELSPKVLHYPKLGLIKPVDENLYQKNLHSSKGAYGQAVKKLKKLQKLYILNSWKDYCMDQRSLEYEYYRTPQRLRNAEIERSFKKNSYFYPRYHFKPRKFSDESDSFDLSSTRDSFRVPTIDPDNSLDNIVQNFDLLDNMKQNMIDALEDERVQKCAKCGSILWNPNNGMCTECTTK